MITKSEKKSINSKKFFFCNETFSIKKFIVLFYLAILIALYFGIFPSILNASSKPQQDNITIKGQVKNNDSNISLSEGLDVVLLKYILNENGEVIPLGPQGRVKTKNNGKFKFVSIIPDLKAGFQLGTRFKGVLYSSKIFFLKEGDKSIDANIIIPSISYEVEKLRISNMSIVVEPRLGKVLITEIVFFSNPSKTKINTINTPLEIKLPKEIKNFKMLSKSPSNNINHQIENSTLKISHTFRKGDTQIIYQYNLTAWFGSLRINRIFNHPFDIIGVFIPTSSLNISSDMLIFSGKQRFEKTTYLTWKGKLSDSNSLTFKVSNIPSTSLQYLIVTIILLFLFSFTVLLFIRKKLKKLKHKRK